MPKEHSPAGGVKPFPIAGRYVSERERLAGMTDGERAWRAQWLKDQILSKHEPVHVPELERELMNPIRRFYRYPLDCVERMMMPVVGPAYSAGLRYFFGKVGISVFALYATVYYFKYHQNDWTRPGGWRVISSRTVCLPGDPEYPKLSDRTKPSDYADRGFKNSPI